MYRFVIILLFFKLYTKFHSTVLFTITMAFKYSNIFIFLKSKTDALNLIFPFHIATFSSETICRSEFATGHDMPTPAQAFETRRLLVPSGCLVVCAEL